MDALRPLRHGGPREGDAARAARAASRSPSRSRWSFPRASDQPAVDKLWAAERIRDLERAVAARAAAPSAMKERIVSSPSRTASSRTYTSFVVVEKRSGDRRTSGSAGDARRPRQRSRGLGHVPARTKKFERLDDARRSVSRHKMARPMMAAPAPRSPSPAPGAPLPSARAMMAPPPPPAPGRSSPSKPQQAEAKADMSIVRAMEEAAPPMEAAMDEGAASLLQQQLATGLWGTPTGGTEDTIRATAGALLALFDDGITTSHAIYGAQVKKAVEALLPLLPAIASSSPRLFELALLATWLVASGPRTRRLVTELAARSGVSFGDEAATKARAKELAAAP